MNAFSFFGFDVDHNKTSKGRLATSHHIVTMELQAVEDNLEGVSEHGSQPAMSEKDVQSFRGDDIDYFSDTTVMSQQNLGCTPHDIDHEIQLSQTAGSETDTEYFHKSQSTRKSSQKPSPTQDDILSFITLSDQVDELRYVEMYLFMTSANIGFHSIKQKFPSMTTSIICNWLQEVCCIDWV